MPQSTKLLLPLLLVGCNTGLLGVGDDDGATRPNSYSGAKMTVSLTADNDVTGFHFEVNSVPCDAGGDDADFWYSENVMLDSTVFPGRIEFLEEAPLDAESAHRGSDFFIALDPGCYVVTATPISWASGDDFTCSEDCGTATSDPLEVVGGYTTETTLISQCEGDLVGGLDALVVTNTPPVVIPNIENKFNNQCETVQICAQGWDPDDDPISFEFENLTPDHDFYSVDADDLKLIGFEDGHRLWEQCYNVVSEDIADYTVEIKAYDMAYDEDGNEVEIEELIGQDSHGWVQVPVHTGWTRSNSCVEADGSITTTMMCGPGGDPVLAPGCNVITDEEMMCSGDYTIDPAVSALVCCDGHLMSNFYPDCE